MDILDNQSVERGRLCDFGRGRLDEVLFLPLARRGGWVSNDKVDLVGRAALVGTKHDCEWGLYI
jgi:hypothetical protein